VHIFHSRHCKVAGNFDPVVAVNFDPPEANRYPDRKCLKKTYQEGGNDERAADKRSAYDEAGGVAYT
jgi:hypothetical protein